jgi:hypothetical protein
MRLLSTLHTPPNSRSEETEPDHFIVAQQENYPDGPMLPPAPLLRRNRNDLLSLRHKSLQVVPRRVDTIHFLTFFLIFFALALSIA